MILKVNFWCYLKTDIPGNHYLKLTNKKTLRFDIISHHADKQNYFLNFQREFIKRKLSVEYPGEPLGKYCDIPCEM